jgi:2-polyprenyl-6-methoxyphenol hydroxylase-like FAD-dependent oxidoreductase
VKNVLIVGGGIAGQVLACSLAQRGISCEVVEIKPDWQIVGAAMTLQGNALRALLDIGLTGQVVAAGWQGGSHPVVFTDTLGQTVLDPNVRNMVGEGYPPMIAIRRQALHEVLLRAVQKAGVPIRMGTTVTSIADHGDSVDVIFNDSSTGRYDLVVGADGIRSVVRSLVCGEVQPQYSGFANWRALLPRPPSVERMVWLWGYGRSVGILPLDGNQIYVAGVTKEKDVTRYPAAELARLFREKFRTFGGVMPDVLALADAGPWLYTVMEEVKLDPPWYRGRVVMIGDAAHAACPFWAQGAAMAMEDAVVLGRLLGEQIPVETALQKWMARRFDRCMVVQQGSYDTGVLTHRDPESDAPKLFPPAVRERLAAQFHEREAKMSEAI